MRTRDDAHHERTEAEVMMDAQGKHRQRNADDQVTDEEDADYLRKADILRPRRRVSQTIKFCELWIKDADRNGDWTTIQLVYPDILIEGNRTRRNLSRVPTRSGEAVRRREDVRGRDDGSAAEPAVIDHHRDDGGIPAVRPALENERRALGLRATRENDRHRREKGDAPGCHVHAAQDAHPGDDVQCARRK